MNKLLLLLFIFSGVVGLSQKQESKPVLQNLPAVKWKFTTKGSIVGSPTSDGSSIFVGSYDSCFYAIDKNSGAQKWKIRIGGPIASSAILQGDKLYFYGGDGNLHCRDKNTGKLIWNYKTLSGALPDRKYDWPDYYQSSPVMSEGTIYFGSGDGRLYAIDATTGKHIWNFETGDVVHTAPAISGNKIFVGSFDGHLYALNRSNGQQIWKFKTTGQRFFPRGEINGNPVVHKGVVYFGSRDFNFYALDEELGYCLWLKTFERGWALPITPKDSVLYVGTSDDRLLLAVDRVSGRTLWNTNLQFNIFGGMATTPTTGFVGTLSGKFFGIDLKTGAIKWTFETESHKKNRSRYLKEDDEYVDNIGALIRSGNDFLAMYRAMGGVFGKPLLVDDTVYFGTYDGVLYALK